MERAVSTSFLLPVSDPELTSGPIMNILEQWIALVFRALLPHDLKDNLDSESHSWVPAEERQKGINIREPLGQGMPFNFWPMKPTGFKWTFDSLKREFFQAKQDRDIQPRREAFLRGDLFEDSF